MLPNVCFTQIAEAFAANDWDTVAKLAGNLALWMEKGGIPPKITGRQDFDALVVKCTVVALLEHGR